LKHAPRPCLDSGSMSRPIRIASLVVSVAAGVLAGCGGGGGSEQVTRAELVKRADAICAAEQASFDRVQAHPPPSSRVAAEQTDELIGAAESANSELRGLAPPDRLEAAYMHYLEARDRAVDQMKRGKQAADEADSGAYGAAQAAEAREATRRAKLARKLGLKVCGA
jgi:hypothetical protein